ncbi:MAG TPA: hypothetical protein VFS05_16195 [Gemmatimonadaceae bacterium]|nr:hypothetical protein [Gemmatimonadaceae bacterium]
MSPRTRPAPRLARLAALALAAIALATPASAQALDPGARWRTLRTPHFDVHFAAELEEPARRAAASAETAYVRLAEHLVPPRGRIDLVLSDDVDYTNGYATPVPSNRVVVYANPPLNVPSLRFYDDWLTLVITHELTHIFHLDRARGWWALGQHVFGRLPWLMPNLYQPAWVTEGLATYYESALTGSGRVHGAHERMIVEASAMENDLPRLSQLSLASSRYPGGEMAYAYGALFFDFLAHAHGDSSVRRYVERSSRELLPWRLDHVARESFGVSFDDAWRAWRDSLRRATAGRPDTPVAGWRDLTREGRGAAYPRWSGDTAIFYSASPGKEVLAGYRVDTAGRATRLGRRNSVDAATPLPDGSLLLAQLEFTDAYHLRSDLFVERGGRQRRLTSGARLVGPDARADGEIAAVRLGSATNQLVRVSADGKRITPLTTAAPDTQWAEPRWSPRGDRIAVTRWTRGGWADIVVLDTLGRLVAQLTRDRAVDSSPSWLPDGSGVLFTSDRSGIADVYLARLDALGDDGAGEPPVERLSRAATGLLYPAASPDAVRLTAVRFRNDGWHVGVAPLDGAEREPAPAPLPALDGAPPAGPPARDTGRVRGYSPWRDLVPRAWTPLIGETAAGHASFGAEIGGSDVVGRHAYSAQLLLDPRGEDHEWSAGWRYARLRQPVIGLSAWQEWSRFSIVDGAGAPLGTLRRRARVAALSLSFQRPRARTYSFASVGGELERRRYLADPAPLLDTLDAFYRSEPLYRSLVGSAGWSNLQRPALAISPEDGISVAASTRWRWLRGESGVRSRSATVVTSAFKGLDLGGFAHHVLAARAAIGYSAGRVPEDYSVGGVSGAPTVVLPGVVLGERRTFGVRGFPPGARDGRRAVSGSLEYRAPLGELRRGVRWLPIFLDRSSITAFGDAGTADDGDLGDPLRADAWLASAGAELGLDAAFQYDIPSFVRLGVAVPVVDHSLRATRGVSVYLRLGASF